VADPIAFKYRAFLSYSHRDKAWCEWLHGALENFRIDTDLIGRATPAGPVPRRLRPIFRDRDDFSAGHSLTEQTIAARDSAQFLIAICSPDAAKSYYVNEEIRHFKARGRGEYCGNTAQAEGGRPAHAGAREMATGGLGAVGEAHAADTAIQVTLTVVAASLDLRAAPIGRKRSDGIAVITEQNKNPRFAAWVLPKIR
jgi:hypothetical protein